MAYVKIRGGGGIDVAEYLSSLPTYFGISGCSANGPADCWRSVHCASGSYRGQTLLCDGKVTTKEIGTTDATFVIQHTDGTTETNSGYYGNYKTFTFHKGDKYWWGGESSSLTLSWDAI